MTRPYKQGDLGGLCGVYNVLNGVKILLYSELEKMTGTVNNFSHFR